MIDFSKDILDLDGNPVLRPEAEDKVSVTLGWVCRSALVLELEADRQKTGDEKLRRIALALAIPQDGNGELSAKDISLICDRVSMGYSALMAYRVTELLDPAALPARN